MSERKINLEEVLNKHLVSRTSLEEDYDTYIFIKRAMLEAIRQSLELAAENANELHNNRWRGYPYIVNKQAILDTINQIE